MTASENRFLSCEAWTARSPLIARSRSPGGRGEAGFDEALPPVMHPRRDGNSDDDDGGGQVCDLT